MPKRRTPQFRSKGCRDDTSCFLFLTFPKPPEPSLPSLAEIRPTCLTCQTCQTRQIRPTCGASLPPSPANFIAPVTAPVIGGLVAESVGWQGIFWALLGLGALILAMCVPFRESLLRPNRNSGSWISIFSSFAKLLKLKYFVVYVLLFAFAQSVLFAYISSGSFRPTSDSPHWASRLSSRSIR